MNTDIEMINRIEQIKKLKLNDEVIVRWKRNYKTHGFGSLDGRGEEYNRYKESGKMLKDGSFSKHQHHRWMSFNQKVYFMKYDDDRNQVLLSINNTKKSWLRSFCWCDVDEIFFSEMTDKYFCVDNVDVDWNTMGITQEEWDSEERMIYNGRIYEYDERYCQEGELVLSTFKSKGDDVRTIQERLYSCLGYEDSWLNRRYGLYSESFDVDLFNDEEHERNTREVISYEDIQKKRNFVLSHLDEVVENYYEK